jgi:hypothetical protein
VYGFRVLVEDAGLTLEEIRPGIDGISLIQRQWFGRRKEHGRWFELSPLNIEIDQSSSRHSSEPSEVNLRKLQFAGHFSFRVRKPGAEPRFLPLSASDDEAWPSPSVAPMVPLGAPPPPPPSPAPAPRRARVARWARNRARLGVIPGQRR